MTITFTSPITTATPPNPYEIAVGDVTGDGKTDLVVLTYGDISNGGVEQVAVLKGDGQGSFQTIQTFRVDDPGSQFEAGYAGWNATGIALADIDKDGDLDLVRSEAGSLPAGDRGRVVISLNDGSGIFHDTPSIDTSGPSNAVAVGDVNGDGKLDIVTANSPKINESRSPYFDGHSININVIRTFENLGTVSVLLGSGAGNSKPRTTSTQAVIRVRTSCSPTSISMGTSTW
jgi:FG-GAP-like repeat